MVHAAQAMQNRHGLKIYKIEDKQETCPAHTSSMQTLWNRDIEDFCVTITIPRGPHQEQGWKNPDVLHRKKMPAHPTGRINAKTIERPNCKCPRTVGDTSGHAIPEAEGDETERRELGRRGDNYGQA